MDSVLTVCSNVKWCCLVARFVTYLLFKFDSIHLSNRPSFGFFFYKLTKV